MSKRAGGGRCLESAAGQQVARGRGPDAQQQAPPYPDGLIGLLQGLERDGMRDARIGDLLARANAMAANEDWVVDTLLPAAQARAAAYRNPPGGRGKNYFERMCLMRWTKPPTPGTSVYDVKASLPVEKCMAKS